MISLARKNNSGIVNDHGLCWSSNLTDCQVGDTTCAGMGNGTYYLNAMNGPVSSDPFMVYTWYYMHYYNKLTSFSNVVYPMSHPHATTSNDDHHNYNLCSDLNNVTESSCPAKEENDQSMTPSMQPYEYMSVSNDVNDQAHVRTTLSPYGSITNSGSTTTFETKSNGSSSPDNTVRADDRTIGRDKPYADDLGVLLRQTLKQRRKRRHRTIFSEKQIGALEQSFKFCPYPDINERETLADLLGLKEERIEIWFKNRRAKVRRVSYDTERVNFHRNIPT